MNPSSEHAEWIIKIYADRAAKDQPILSEDLSDIHDEISYFKKATIALEEKAESNILNDYASYEDFTKVITPMKLKHEQKSEQRAIVDEIKAETTMLYQGEEGSIVVPHTVRASQFWGQTTKWCISGEEADTHFTETYNPQSPCLMYVPKTSKLETMGGYVISGKVAVVNNEIYNEADNTETKLPNYILPLRDAAVRSAALGKSEYIQLFGDMQTQSNQQPSPSRSYLEDLPQEQQSLLKSIDGKPDETYRALFLNHQDLAKDKNIVLTAIQQDGKALECAHEDLFENKDFVESILDITENTDKEEKHRILNQLHRVPTFYGHITADIGDLHTRLTNYNLEQEQSPDVPEILLYNSASTEQQISL